MSWRNALLSTSANIANRAGTRSSFELDVTTRYAATLFLVMFSFWYSHGPQLLLDADTYWHIAVGERIWRTGTFPQFDDYSFTMAGSRWIAKEWLSQLLFFGAYRWANWSGVVLLTAATAAASYLLLFSWLMRRVNPLVALTMTAVSITLSMNSVLARPQVFYYLLMAVCVCGLVDAVEQRKTPWWIIPLTAVWANLHASFPIAIVLSVFFGSEAFFTAKQEERSRTGLRWTLAVLLAIAATGATPYGYEPLWVSLRIVGDDGTKYINEWEPMKLNLQGFYGIAYLLGSLAILATARAGSDESVDACLLRRHDDPALAFLLTFWHSRPGSHRRINRKTLSPICSQAQRHSEQERANPILDCPGDRCRIRDCGIGVRSAAKSRRQHYACSRARSRPELWRNRTGF